MNDAVETTGKTVEDAIDAALEQLGATEDEVEIQILAEGGPRGIFGRRVEAARVRVKRRDERTPEDLALLEEEGPELLEGPTPPEFTEQAEAAKEFLAGLLGAIGLEGEVTVATGPLAVTADVAGPEMGLLIGRRGATLEAVQELVRAAVQRKTATRPRVNLDIEGYRSRLRSGLERRARDAAARARRSQRPVTLEPMSAFQRKVVHDALAGFDGVATSSEGEDPSRRVVIRPKGEPRRGSAPRGGGSRGSGARGQRGAGSRQPPDYR
ncbi:MAG: Jag N-terminal domain-containing protein [Acidobacteria bacterium]|nr:Jag N-terminal domain-containing protein [Acidobacteriota bacterium]